VPEDPLQAEDVAAVRQEGTGEGVAQDVGRAAGLDARAARQAADELMNPSRGQAPAPGSSE
jgi:hypothetical protein